MTGWSRHTGLAVALPREGIDTDQLLPARFMSRKRSEGYGDALLHDLRQDPAFPLNHAPGASILVARRNFGGGSSREGAVYALVDAGFRAVIAPSFGDIFAGNAVNNGLLPARVEDAAVEALLAALGAPAEVTVDLEAAEIRGVGRTLGFALDPIWRQKLVNGWDDIDLTQAYGAAIARFAEADRTQRPWAAAPALPR